MLLTAVWWHAEMEARGERGMVEFVSGEKHLCGGAVALCEKVKMALPLLSHGGSSLVRDGCSRFRCSFLVRLLFPAALVFTAMVAALLFFFPAR